jgi:hypothetical protein
MTTFPGSPRLLKGGIVLLDAETSTVQRIIALQYNPETLSRTLQVQGVGGEGGDRSEAMRLKGPPVETIKLEAEIDAADQLEFATKDSNVAQYGIQPQLAALETLIYPASINLEVNNLLAQLGTLEIAPMEVPLTLFVWSKKRILPVRLTEFSITEEAFDPSLNPLRAKVSLSLRVLSVDDLGFDHKGSSLFMTYHKEKERLASISQGKTFSPLGIHPSSIRRGANLDFLRV